MAEVIRMPRMSDTMEEGNIVGWLKKVGDSVEPGDILAEVETDKATMELESYHEGTLLYIGVKEGPVLVNGVLAVIGEKGEDYETLLKEADTPVTSAEPNSDKGDKPKPQAAEINVAAPTISSSSTSGKVIQRIKASPLAKKIAEEKGIDLFSITGTGEGGRIVKKDVESAAGAKGSTGSTSSATPSYTPSQVVSDFEYGTQPLSQMRKTIAKRLSESKFTSPHFYLTVEINMDKTIDARKDINADGTVKISFNDFVVKAAAAALRKHPKVNASWDGDTITYHNNVNIGVAVAVDEGLLVPVVNVADTKPLSVINAEVRALAVKARNKKLSLDEMQGNTFTISNLGMFGIEEFTAIINPPDACILAVGGIIQKPIVKDGNIVVGNMMKVTLSSDHRVVDGAVGAQFLNTFKSFLENPIRIIV